MFLPKKLVSSPILGECLLERDVYWRIYDTGKHAIVKGFECPLTSLDAVLFFSSDLLSSVFKRLFLLSVNAF